MTKEAWLANYNEVGDYFGALKKAIDEVRAENAAKETIYEPLEVELSSPYGTFTPDNVNNLPSMLAKEHESDFNVLKELLKAVWKNYVERIKAHEPDHDAYYEYRHGAEATKLWKENEAEIYAFLTTFETLLDAEKERRFGENSAVEDLRLDGKSLVDAIRDTGGKEYFKRDELDANLEKRKTNEMLDGFVPQKTARKAAQFAKKEFGIDVDRRLSVDILNDLNQELIRARNMFGTVGIIENVKTDQSVLDRGAFGSYNRDTRSILLRPGMGRPAATYFIRNEPEGQLSTRSPYHGYRHEIGHAILRYCEESLQPLDRTRLYNELREVYNNAFNLTNDGFVQLSDYASRNVREMVAEAVAQVMNGNISPLASRIMIVLKGNVYDTK